VAVGRASSDPPLHAASRAPATRVVATRRDMGKCGTPPHFFPVRASVSSRAWPGS
jgi:hypothetical protein